LTQIVQAKPVTAGRWQVGQFADVAPNAPQAVFGEGIAFAGDVVPSLRFTLFCAGYTPAIRALAVAGALKLVTQASPLPFGTMMLRSQRPAMKPRLDTMVAVPNCRDCFG
jgi:hypothetical protein